MNQLLQFIYNKLSEAQKPVYLEQAEENAVFPYIVFRLPNSVNVESDRQDYTLQIDIWDNQPDTINLEILTSAVDKLFYRLKHVDEHHLLLFERENKLMLTDEDPKIKRRQLRYTVKQYERVV